MKKIALAFFFYFSICSAYGQILVPELGYSSGFTGLISIGFIDNDKYELPYFQEYYKSHFHPSVGYDFLISNGEYFHGPNLQASYGALIGEGYFGIKGGLSTSLFFNNGNSHMVLEPVITFYVLFFIQIKFYYNLLDTGAFFQNSYDNWSLSLALDISLKK